MLSFLVLSAFAANLKESFRDSFCGEGCCAKFEGRSDLLEINAMHYKAKSFGRNLKTMLTRKASNFVERKANGKTRVHDECCVPRSGEKLNKAKEYTADTLENAHTTECLSVGIQPLGFYCGLVG